MRLYSLTLLFTVLTFSRKRSTFWLLSGIADLPAPLLLCFGVIIK